MARRMLRLLVEGRLASWLVDAAVVTVLQLKLALGLFDEPVPARAPLPRPARAALAARAAAQSAVLLTDPRGVLPVVGTGPILVVAGRPDGRDARAGRRAGPAGTPAARGPSTRPRSGGTRPPAVVVVVDDPEGAEVAIGRLVATGTPCVALVGGADPRALGPLVATTAAVVLCWQPVHLHADAHADVLLGAAEPGGRLPVPITGDGGRVVFPLGHGAGYTSVEYSHLRISPDRGPGPPQLVVQCRVTNAGDRAGKEVVQVYLRDEVASIARTATSLAAFTTVELEPGRTVTVTLPDRCRPARRVEPGDAPRRRAGDVHGVRRPVGGRPAAAGHGGRGLGGRPHRLSASAPCGTPVARAIVAAPRRPLGERGDRVPARRAAVSPATVPGSARKPARSTKSAPARRASPPMSGHPPTSRLANSRTGATAVSATTSIQDRGSRRRARPPSRPTPGRGAPAAARPQLAGGLGSTRRATGPRRTGP